ncbi:MAG: hypothetical protein ABL890_00780 [Candidatus Peribacteraceae bacterium]
MRHFIVALLITSILAPTSALALEGIGPRVTVVGVISSMVISKDQEFQEFGGEMSLKAENGQEVTILLQKDTKIISEGRMNRKEILPINLAKGMQLRVRGWRMGTDALTASLIILENVELNPALSTSGILQSIDATGITVLTQDGQSVSYAVTAETEVSINYTLRNIEGLTLIGKQVLLTMNPRNRTLLRSIRITGTKEEATLKPTTLQLGRRKQ